MAGSVSQLDVVDRRRGASGRMIGCRWIYGRLGGDREGTMAFLDCVYEDEDGDEDVVDGKDVVIIYVLKDSSFEKMFI